jgi:membrane-bound lytic murein transglycosylase D
MKLSVHKVKKGETLSSIAKRYGQSVNRLMKENDLKSRRIRPGQELVIVQPTAAKRKLSASTAPRSARR